VDVDTTGERFVGVAEDLADDGGVVAGVAELGPRQAMPPLVRGRPATGEDATVPPSVTSQWFSAKRGGPRAAAWTRRMNDDDVALRADEREPSAERSGD
jgi:hypothetical protein